MSATIAALFEQLMPEQAKEVNAICDHFERSCRGGEIPPLESILPTINPDIQLVALHELVLVDVMYRHSKPSRETLEGYRQRFTDLDVAWLSTQLGIQNRNTLDSTLPHDDPWFDLGGASNQTTAERIGKFEIVREIGQGGMGVVYQSLQTDLNRTVALKTLPKLVAHNAEARNRFRAEVESVARLHHPHIVQIFEIGMDGGTPYYSMEFVEGGSLAEVARKHPLAPKTAAKLVGYIARAIHYAHENGVVHRDLKPGNILLAPARQLDGVRLDAKNIGVAGTNVTVVELFEPKIADFGLAKRLDAESQDTLQGATLGTPSYMAPEQATSASSVNTACDIYSIGAILYELLVSRPPFHGTTAAETIQQVLHDEPVPVRKMRPDIPLDLETICLKCLSKQPAKRYSTARELAEDLDRFLDGRSIRARRASWMERLARSVKRHPAVAAMVASLVLGFTGTTWQWRMAEANRIKADINAETAISAHRREVSERERVQRTLISLANLEYQSNHTQRSRELLEQTPEELRTWEWQYVKHRVESGFKDLYTFDMAARAVAISPDGSKVAGCSGVWGKPDQGEVRVWERQSGRLLWKHREHPGPVMNLNFDPSGQKLILCGAHFTRGMSDGSVVVSHAESGKSIWKNSSFDAQVAMFSADGQHCIIGDTKGYIHVVDAESGNAVRRWQAHQDYISDLAISEQGDLLFSTSRDGFVRIWSFENGLQLDEDSMNSPERVSCSIDGKSVSVCTHHGELRAYELNGGQMRLLSKSHLGERVGAMQYSVDGQYLITSALNHPIKLVSCADNRVIRELYGHDGSTVDIAQNASGCFIASCGIDGTVKVWDLAESDGAVKHPVGGPYIADVEFLPDSQLVAMAMAHNPGNRARELAVKIWDVTQSKFVRHLNGHTDWLTSLAVDHRNQLLVSGSLDCTARVWNLADWSEAAILVGHESTVVDVTFGLGGNIVTAEKNGSIRHWQLTNGKSEIRESWKLPEGECSHIASQYFGKLLAASNASGKVWIFQTGASKPIRELDMASEVTELIFSPDESWLAISGLKSGIELWDARNLVRSVSNAKPEVAMKTVANIHDICFSHDNRRLVSCGSDRAVRLWDLTSGDEVFSIPNVGLNGRLNRVSFSPNGRTILQSDQNMAESRSFDSIPIDYVHWHEQEANKATSSRMWNAVAHHKKVLCLLQPSNALALRQYANSLAEIGKTVNAIEAYRAVLHLDTQRDVNDEYILSLLLLKNNQLDERRELQSRMVSEFGNSTDPAKLNTLAWSFALHTPTENLADVLAVAERAAATKRYGTLNTLGAVYLRAGRFEDAIEVLNASMAGSKDKAGTVFDWLLLSISYSKKGDHQAGRKWLKKCLRFVDQSKTNGSYTLGNWSSQYEIATLLEEATLLDETIESSISVASPD